MPPSKVSIVPAKCVIGRPRRHHPQRARTVRFRQVGACPNDDGRRIAAHITSDKLARRALRVRKIAHLAHRRVRGLWRGAVKIQEDVVLTFRRGAQFHCW